MRTLLIVGALLTSVLAFPATYYVDYDGGADTNNGLSTGAAWKHAPGMTGCANSCAAATPTADDVFVFKGGTTWVSSFPWTIAWSGSSGHQITFTVDETWYSGGAFTKPIFDAEAGEPAGGMLQALDRSFLTFNNLSFVNYGTSGAADGKKAIQLDNSSDVRFTDCVFATYSWLTVYTPYTTTGTYTGLTFTGNDVSHTSSAVWIGLSSTNTTVQNCNLSNNAIHDFTSQIGGGVHGDGLLHAYAEVATDITRVTAGQAYNNVFYGDFRRSFGETGGMTAFIFTEGSRHDWEIFNNVFRPSPVEAVQFDSYMSIGGRTGTYKIYNNSGYAASSPGSAFLHTGGTAAQPITIDVQNNICTGFNECVYVEVDETVWTSDYNVWDSTNNTLKYGSSSQSYATWQAVGRDVNGVLGSDPVYVNPPTSLLIAASSPALGAGVNLTGLDITALNSDKSGIARPATGAWDAGAYQYVPPASRIGGSAKIKGKARVK